VAPSSASPRGEQDSVQHSVRFLAVGDINLGRSVGQHILQGDTLYPFVAVRESLQRYDVVFGNLESSLSEQGGETESRRSNVVFTGPPAGARTLALGGVTMVSIANNHALDYGSKAFRETITHLRNQQITCAGDVEAGALRPAVVVRNGIRIGLFAVTDVMNGAREGWRSVVAPADTGLVLPALRFWRDSLDIIIVSYHGGVEYADRQTRKTEEFARSVVDAGADLFLGHHPHVPFGLEERHGRWIVYSLGNFVFYQPGRFWARRGLAVAFDISRTAGGVQLSGKRCIPVAAGLQPSFFPPGRDADTTLQRVTELTKESN
jgi:poly-gamma-glutamate capsule biosynthesis protein CapA/YwtB (metallophosphatase superfamily)